MNIGILILLGLLIAGSMTFIVSWFTRKLRSIERERWGDKKDVN